jgi:putative photosynthetic complex assembly protein
MSREIDDQPFPKAALIAAGVLISLSISAVAFVQLTGIGQHRSAPPAAIESRALLFDDADRGRIVVRDAGTQGVVDTIEPGDGRGFISTVLRSMAYSRKIVGAGRERPFDLVRNGDGRLALVDPVTNRHVELSAFGPDNARAFEKLLNQRRASQ